MYIVCEKGSNKLNPLTEEMNGWSKITILCLRHVETFAWEILDLVIL